MAISGRMISAIFTTLPGLFLFILFLLSSWLGREYWWGTYLIVLITLLMGSLSFGFVLPTLLQKLRVRQPWIWILAQGLLAWSLAAVVLGLLNMTPLCVGQDNGDGNNSFGMCMFMTALSSIVYMPLYFVMLAISAVIGQWALQRESK